MTLLRIFGYTYENYGDRSVSRYKALGYAHFDPNDIVDMSYQPGDLFLGAKSLPEHTIKAFSCHNWSTNIQYARVGRKLVYAKKVVHLSYTEKILTSHQQRWTNRMAPRPYNYTIPVSSVSSRGWKPTIIGIGSGACGSTSFYTTLMQHPRFVPATIKETNVWLSTNDLESYKPFFNVTNQYQLTAEFSPYYMTSEVAYTQITHYLPTTWILLLIRDPYHQCTSSYTDKELQSAWNLANDCTFHRHLRSAPRDKHDYRPCDIQHHYIDSITRWNRSNLVVVNATRFRHHPTDVLNDLTDLIGVESHVYPRIHMHKTHTPRTELPMIRGCLDRFIPVLNQLVKTVTHI
jgi:hypothetical protein